MMVENTYMLHATYVAPAAPTHALPFLPQALSTRELIQEISTHPIINEIGAKFSIVLFISI